MDRLDSPAIEWSMIICTARWDILQFSGTARCCQTPSQVQPWREFPVHHFHWLHWSSWKRRSPVGPIRFLVCGQVSLNRISRAGRFFFFYVRISLETKRPKFHPKNICESIKSLIKHDGFLVVFNVGMGYCLFFCLFWLVTLTSKRTSGIIVGTLGKKILYFLRTQNWNSDRSYLLFMWLWEPTVLPKAGVYLLSFEVLKLRQTLLAW